jgi:hypothetical protein
VNGFIQRRRWRMAQRRGDCAHGAIRAAYASELDDLGIDAYLRCEDCGIGFDNRRRPIDPAAPKRPWPTTMTHENDGGGR